MKQAMQSFLKKKVDAELLKERVAGMFWSAK
jgi:hypothetical protein